MSARTTGAISGRMGAHYARLRTTVNRLDSTQNRGTSTSIKIPASMCSCSGVYLSGFAWLPSAKTTSAVSSPLPVANAII